MEVQEKIKFVDATFTWPHPTDKGYFVNATFVRTDDDTPYLIYCPRNTTAISIEEETLSPFCLIRGEEFGGYKKVTLTQQIQSSSKEVLFYILRLSEQKPKEIKKDDIEKLFNIKVVD